MIPSVKDCPEKLTLHVDTEKSSAKAVYEYFSGQLERTKSLDEDVSD